MTTNSSEKFYDRLTFLYPIVDFFLKPQKEVFFCLVNGYPPGRLLEIGIGDGANLKYYTAHDIIGIDTSASMLARAAKYAKGKVELHNMSGENLAFPNDTFDYVTLSHVIAVVGNPEKLLEEVHRVLKPNGKLFILNHFTPNNWLKYLDKSLQKISRLCHFKSMFELASLRKLENFKRVRQINAGPFSYFKILIYEKNV